MKRLHLMISAALWICSATAAFAAEAAEKVLPKPAGKESTKTAEKPQVAKPQKKSPLGNKAKPKASGDPHVNEQPAAVTNSK